MSKVIKLENFFVWSFPDKDNFPGYNFSATPQSCGRCSRLLESYVVSYSENESLILELSPPTRKVIETVLTGDTKVVPFYRLRFTVDRQLSFTEESGELVLKLPLSDVRLFQSALDAMESGLDSRWAGVVLACALAPLRESGPWRSYHANLSFRKIWKPPLYTSYSACPSLSVPLVILSRPSSLV